MILYIAGSKNWPISEAREIPPGSIERGERAKEHSHTWEVWQNPQKKKSGR